MAAVLQKSADSSSGSKDAGVPENSTTAAATDAGGSGGSAAGGEQEGDDKNVSFSLTKSFMFLSSFVLPQNVSFENVSFNVSFVIRHSSFVICH